MILEDILGIELNLHPHLHIEEINDMVEREEAVSLGLQALERGRISVDDFFDIVELAGLDMDEYINTVGDNLIWVP
jgi:hypothetical protein